MKTPYLIQRAEINNERNDEMRFSQAVDLDYMGSAEFEFGATAKSLRVLENAFLTNKAEDGYMLQVTDVAEIATKSRSGKQKPLKVLHCFTDEEFEKYLPYLHKMRAGKLRAKEPFYVGKGTQDLTTIPRSLPPLDKETEALLNEL